MNKIISIFIYLLLSAVAWGQEMNIPKQMVYPVRERFEIQTLNGIWNFQFVPEGKIPPALENFYQPGFDDSRWDKITVPGNWETEGKKEPQYGADILECFGLYRTTFQVNEAWKSKHVILRFDGVLFGYTVYVNGQEVGYWGSAYNPCQFDITPYIRFDQPNVLAVKVTTRTKGWRFDLNDCWALSGIFRDVELFSVPNVHLSDVTFKSFLKENNKALISFDVDVQAFASQQEKLRVQVLLNDASGRNICAFTDNISLKSNQASHHFEQTIENPICWTAETPYLYKMQVYILNDKDFVTQQITEKVGIREVSIRDGILLLNNQPVSLRGVCMNEIHPTKGRALTDFERMQDFQLLKAANINYMRTAHYPFHPRFHEMCDELGFYVICEVPFGYGDKNLEKPDYLDELCTRAEATLTRDKNHPSIIVWSVGNENPYTEIVDKTLQYIKKKDETRPRALPQVGTYFMNNIDRMADNVDLYTFHYQSPEAVEKIALMNKKPIILTEYSHALGRSFDALEAQYAMIRKYPNIAGGSIWAWADQALLRNRSKQEFLEDTVTQGVWLDSIRYYDSFTDKGTDGIIYANRYPQENYWQVRKVYSPVVFTDTIIHASSGKQQLVLAIENRFDFISLKGYSCMWNLKHYQQLADKGVIDLNTPAQSNGQVKIETTIPSGTQLQDYCLNLVVFNKDQKAIYERNIPLSINGNTVNYPEMLQKQGEGKIWKIKKGKELQAATDKCTFTIDEKGKIKITGKTGKVLLNSELLLRVGRKPSINLVNLGMRRKDVFYWNPYMLTPEIRNQQISEEKNNVKVILDCRWNRVEKQGEYIEGNVNINISKNGVVSFDYDLKPYNTTGSLMECGLSLSMEPEIRTFRWLGDGPYTSAPGKTAYNERDVWGLDKDDFRFAGNRGKTDLVALLNTENYGIGIAGNRSNFGVENIDGKIVFSQNAIVSGYGTKLSQPTLEAKTSKVKSIRGSFCLTVLDNTENNLFDNIFKPYPTVLPEIPFLKSYEF